MICELTQEKTRMKGVLLLLQYNVAEYFGLKD